MYLVHKVLIKSIKNTFGSNLWPSCTLFLYYHTVVLLHQPGTFSFFFSPSQTSTVEVLHDTRWYRSTPKAITALLLTDSPYWSYLNICSVICLQILGRNHRSARLLPPVRFHKTVRAWWPSVLHGGSLEIAHGLLLLTRQHVGSPVNTLLLPLHYFAANNEAFCLLSGRGLL